MHITLRTHVHIFSKTFHVFNHHKLELILATLVVLMLLVSYLPQSPLYLFRPIVPVKAHVTPVIPPLTYIENPEFVHELETRTAYIMQHLERLKKQIQADKVYVVSYNHHIARFRPTVRISRTFEVGDAGLTAPAHAYAGLSRMSWLFMRQYAYDMGNSLTPSAPLSRIYGAELHDPDGKPIGYLGADYLQENVLLAREVSELLERTAALIEAGFLQPIKNLE